MRSCQVPPLVGGSTSPMQKGRGECTLCWRDILHCFKIFEVTFQTKTKIWSPFLNTFYVTSSFIKLLVFQASSITSSNISLLHISLMMAWNRLTKNSTIGLLVWNLCRKLSSLGDVSSKKHNGIGTSGLLMFFNKTW